MHGATGSGIGAFMIIPGTGYEASSGGPFFRWVSLPETYIDSVRTDKNVQQRYRQSRKRSTGGILLYVPRRIDGFLSRLNTHNSIALLIDMVRRRLDEGSSDIQD